MRHLLVRLCFIESQRTNLPSHADNNRCSRLMGAVRHPLVSTPPTHMPFHSGTALLRCAFPNAPFFTWLRNGFGHSTSTPRVPSAKIVPPCAHRRANIPSPKLVRHSSSNVQMASIITSLHANLHAVQCSKKATPPTSTQCDCTHSQDLT